MAALILFSAAVILLYMTAWWLYAAVIHRNDVADVAWGLGFVALAVALVFRSEFINFKTVVAIGMVAAWGLRLATHIAWRHRGKPEDARYIAMREGWKYKTLQSYTNVFLSQGFFLLLVAVPIMLFFSDTTRAFHWYNAVGLAIWAAGFTFEAVSDYQLARFIKNPAHRGQIMRFGLWRNSRHPNYFGEISLWWGFFVFTLVTPYWYLGLIGPATITFLILGVSGIPMLERRYRGNQDYERYQATTSAFFPLPRKK